MSILGTADQKQCAEYPGRDEGSHGITMMDKRESDDGDTLKDQNTKRRALFRAGISEVGKPENTSWRNLGSHEPRHSWPKRPVAGLWHLPRADQHT